MSARYYTSLPSSSSVTAAITAIVIYIKKIKTKKCTKNENDDTQRKQKSFFGCNFSTYGLIYFKYRPQYEGSGILVVSIRGFTTFCCIDRLFMYLLALKFFLLIYVLMDVQLIDESIEAQNGFRLELDLVQKVITLCISYEQ